MSLQGLSKASGDIEMKLIFYFREGGKTDRIVFGERRREQHGVV